MIIAIHLIADVAHVLCDDGKEDQNTAGERAGQSQNDRVQNTATHKRNDAADQANDQRKPAAAADIGHPAALRERLKRSALNNIAVYVIMIKHILSLELLSLLIGHGIITIIIEINVFKFCGTVFTAHRALAGRRAVKGVALRAYKKHFRH